VSYARGITLATGLPSLLRRFDVGQHFFGVAVGFYVLEDVTDLAVGADKEGGTGDALHLLAIHVLLFDDAEVVGHCLILVGQERVGQFVLVLKFFLGGGRVGGDAEYGDAGPGKLGICVAEPARFYGSTGGIGFRIEEEDDRFAAKLLQLDGVSILIR
jgi:hypothetical protein